MKEANKKAIQKTLINLFKLAKELGNSDIPILWELGHYLVDNLILKVCMYVAKDKNEEFKIFKSPSTSKTKDLPQLYKDILNINYPSVPDYDNEVEPHHNRRNIFQHSNISIELSIRKEFVLPYLDISEEIMRICGIIDINTDISPTDLLKTQDSLSKLTKASQLSENLKFQKLFNRLAKTDKTNLGIELKNLLNYEIGRSRFCNTLSMTSSIDGEIFYNDLWSIYNISSIGGYHISIQDSINNEGFNYDNPTQNTHVLKNFLNYLKEKCSVNGIKIHN